ncbi:class I SAM-dependent methyltransferase [Brucella tritici]|uniref:Class I SAM-dependent methyltransferase n=1 Tax=Brucella tritici TaxID=94626 RepID=A0A6N6QBS3_9HYPH|nr:cyclopropane-fatty-acyl-phospholipid synthase family protein [Brucella tritici]KAB2661478.1 class I SAM-dependent methyltransferase [Brucella tritici]KAB2668832.1 class I SAM-dependent methyltransferase [Brucella tritici]KAB2677201.1 class I SAM-dependent methyltransferase [Brucella tritici]
MSQLDEYHQLSASTRTERPAFSPSAIVLKRLLKQVQHGRLVLSLPDGEVIAVNGRLPGPEAKIAIVKWNSLRRLLTGGDIGFAQAYIEGEWTSPHLSSVIRFAARNRDTLISTLRGSGWTRALNRIGHLLNANTRRGSRRNIEAHYDLGNDFYARWLDPSMLYSSAIWTETTHSLESAQEQKLQYISEKLALEGGERILEIGCGWGALAGYLANCRNAHVTGITLSPSQLTWAKAAVENVGLSEAVDLRLQDYRDIQGQFDRIVSIEMFEAVGEAYWPEYFATLKRCLKPGGRAVLQVISIEETRYENYRRKADFIQKFIFPGGFLPSDKVLERDLAKAGLVLKETEHFGRSYALTLAEWRQRFIANWPEIEKLGFDDKFRRLWEYYLCYCEGGFEEGAINVGLYTIEHA